MKVKCVKCLRDERFFIPGNVYKVKHGKITNDNGYTYMKKTNSEVLEFLSRWYLFEKVRKDEIGVKEVKRLAKVGEYVKIVNAVSSYGNYKNGDILQIVDDAYGYARYGHNPGEALYDHEYVVLEGYKPEKEGEQKEPHKFKVGDIVKCNNPVRYCFKEYDMTRCKVTKVSEDGKYISVEILEHKRGSTCKFYGFESNCFDLVEEAPKLYNGKIIFTKGDEMFKTGHIYEVKDGRIKTVEYGQLPMREPLKDIEDVKDYFTGNLDGNRKRKKGWSSYTLELMEVNED